jgi:hypothetical protein
MAAGVVSAQADGLTPLERAMLSNGAPDSALATPPQNWGVDSTTWVTVPASACDEVSNNPYVSSFGWTYGTDTPFGRYFDCWVPLPSGTLVQAIGLEVDDTDGSNDVGLSFRDCDSLSSSCTTLVNQSTSGAPGKTFLGLFNVGLTINNALHYYVIRVYLESGTISNKFRNVFITARLQVSPKPGSATFSDVPLNHWASQHIEALSDSGITAGCGGGSFCPDKAVSRAEMAVFLAKALGLHWAP